MVVVKSVAVRIAATRCVVIPNAVTRCAVIQSAVIQSVVGRGATGVQNVVILFAVRVVAPSVALNEVTPNAVLNVAQDVARDVVIQCVASLCVVLNVVQDVARGAVIPFAVDQCVENQGAMVDSQDGVLPNDGRGVSPVDRLSLVAVQSEVAQDAALFSVQAQL